MFGWHLNVSAVHDEVYRPDAGLSIGVGAPTAHAAMARLLSITTPLGYTTA